MCTLRNLTINYYCHGLANDMLSTNQVTVVRAISQVLGTKISAGIRIQY